MERKQNYPYIKQRCRTVKRTKLKATLKSEAAKYNKVGMDLEEYTWLILENRESGLNSLKIEPDSIKPPEAV